MKVKLTSVTINLCFLTVIPAIIMEKKYIKALLKVSFIYIFKQTLT